MLTAQELENLTALGEAVREISVQAGGIFDALDAGELTMDEYGATGDAAVSGTVGYELSALDAALDDFPELEYAGRYSSSVMSPEAAYIKDRKSVSELDARRIAAEFLGVDESELADAGRSEGAYGVYAFTQELENGQQRYITVTEKGGVVETVSGACTLGGAQTAAEDAEALALEMLGGAFGEEFTRVEMREQTGLYGFTFAPVVDGVALLPDTVEVSVDSATGEVCTWNAHNYIMYHAPRAAMTADVDMETAKSAVPESLSILGARLALTRSDGGVETLCWEFACQNAAGGGVNVFVDAKTGRQAKIELTN